MTRISFKSWNENINDGKYFKTHNCSVMPSGLTRDLKFLDTMLEKKRIDEFEHQRLRVKVIADWESHYKKR